MSDYGSSVATRGLLHCNSAQVTVGFRPLHKPNWLLINKKVNTLSSTPHVNYLDVDAIKQRFFAHNMHVFRFDFCVIEVADGIGDVYVHEKETTLVYVIVFYFCRAAICLLTSCKCKVVAKCAGLHY